MHIIHSQLENAATSSSLGSNRIVNFSSSFEEVCPSSVFRKFLWRRTVLLNCLHYVGIFPNGSSTLDKLFSEARSFIRRALLEASIRSFSDDTSSNKFRRWSICSLSSFFCLDKEEILFLISSARFSNSATFNFSKLFSSFDRMRAASYSPQPKPEDHFG